MSYALTRATLLEVDDSGTQQMLRLKGLHGEEFSQVYRFQPHGFSSVPPVGSEGVLLRMGETERTLALGFEEKSKRIKGLPAGSGVLYDANGNFLKFVGNSASLEAVGQPFTIKVGTFTVEANEIVLKAGGNVARIRPGRIDLGAMIAPNRVMTEAGPSSVVYAVV